jgi:hypothetical protein
MENPIGNKNKVRKCLKIKIYKKNKLKREEKKTQANSDELFKSRLIFKTHNPLNSILRAQLKSSIYDYFNIEIN